MVAACRPDPYVSLVLAHQCEKKAGFVPFEANYLGRRDSIDDVRRIRPVACTLDLAVYRGYDAYFHSLRQEIGLTTGNSNDDWNELWDRFHEARVLGSAERREAVERFRATSNTLGAQLEKLLLAHDSIDEAQLPNLESLLDVGESSGDTGDPQPGDQLGLYEIKKQIGAGGMGIVYLAHQTEPVQRDVALKLLQYGMASRDVLARFGAERQALALMSHSNIARIFDAAVTDSGRPYFVMEYVPGTPITEYCDNHKISIDARLRLFLDVCDGVLHAHQKGIIHRDIKPSNIIVAEENGLPIPKIIDFGIAKATERRLNDDSLHTQVGTLIGTPGYMSPEQAGVVPHDVDIRADVYSLGVLLYELLVGVLPFETTTSANGLLEIQEAIRDEEPLRPSRRLSSISADQQSTVSANRAMRFAALERRLQSDIEWILLKSMDKNRDRRYASVSELSADIGRFLEGLPILARPPTHLYRAGKFVRRHTVGVSIAAAAAVFTVAFAVTMAVQSAQLQRALDQTTLERNRAEQVSDFMVDLFASANPEVSGRSDVTAAEILEDGSKRLQEDLANQPELRAKLLVTIGESYRVLGGVENAKTAVSLLEQALDDLNSDSTQAQQVGAIFNALGTVHHDTGDYDDAEVAYQRALELLKEDKSARSRADVLGNLSVLHTDRGNLSEAEEFGRASLDLLAVSAEPDDPTIARTKQRVAFILHQNGESVEAQEMVLDSLNTIRDYYGETHPSVATALNYAAIIQGGAGDQLGAQQSLREAIDIYRTTHGDDHPYLASTLSNLGLQYNRNAQFDEAVETLTEALRVGVLSYGADHPNVNSFRINLGTTLQDMGRLIEAVPLLQEGLVRDREVLEPGSPYLLATLDRLGGTQHRLGRYDEAEPLLAEAATMRREFLGESNADTGVAILNVALTRLAQGNLIDARELVNESIALQRQLADPSDPLAQSIAGLGQIRLAEGHVDAAREQLQSALTMFGPPTENTVLSVALAGRLLAELEIESNNLDAAEQAYRAAEAALREHAPNEHPDLIRIGIALSALSCRTSADNASLESIRAAREPLAKSIGQDNPELDEVGLAAEQCLAYRESF